MGNDPRCFWVLDGIDDVSKFCGRGYFCFEVYKVKLAYTLIHTLIRHSLESAIPYQLRGQQPEQLLIPSQQQ